MRESYTLSAILKWITDRPNPNPELADKRLDGRLRNPDLYRPPFYALRLRLECDGRPAAASTNRAFNVLKFLLAHGSLDTEREM
ncbi:hypothetical protein BO443_40431 [Burkholderia orbicola]